MTEWSVSAIKWESRFWGSIQSALNPSGRFAGSEVPVGKTGVGRAAPKSDLEIHVVLEVNSGRQSP